MYHESNITDENYFSCVVNQNQNTLEYLLVINTRKRDKRRKINQTIQKKAFTVSFFFIKV